MAGKPQVLPDRALTKAERDARHRQRAKDRRDRCMEALRFIAQYDIAFSAGSGLCFRFRDVARTALDGER